MPYKIGPDGLTVYKVNSDGSLGAKVGKSSSKAKAKKYLKALYANVSDASPKSKEASEWGLTDEQSKMSGRVRNLLTGKIHEAYTTVSDQLSQRGYLSQEQRMEITRLIGELLKSFNRGLSTEVADLPISPEDLSEIASKESLRSAVRLDAVNKLEDYLFVGLEDGLAYIASKELRSVLSPTDGSYRWVTFTSSSFEDRDGEIVSQKAHEADIERMWASGMFGTIDWWHLCPPGYLKRSEKEIGELPVEIQSEGLVIGDCDFSTMYGRIRVESGTFRSKEVAESMYRHQGDLSCSLLFFHPRNEPDGEKVFDHSATFSRAILPKGVASNRAARLFVLPEGGQ